MPDLTAATPAILSIAVALTVVVGGLVAFLVSERSTAAVAPPGSPELPEGVVDVLNILRSAAAVVDVADDVVRATPAAYTFGLVRDRRIPHPQVMALVHTARREGLILDRELELPRGPVGQGVIVVQVRVAPLGSLHILVLAEDRTDARRIEAVRRDFAANVSHELKTPVGAISLLAETLSEAADDPEAVRRFATRTRREADRLSVLVQEIIDLSRVQSAPEPQFPERLDINEAVSEAVERAHLAAQAKDMNVRVTSRRGLMVDGDRALLITALHNLIDNAVRYSEAGTRIMIEATRTGGLVSVAVADEGIGIAADDLDRVFERFFRVDPARSRATGGTGLGLTIVKHVAANHGGEVTVDSALGEGSTFTLWLPAGHKVGPDREASAPRAIVDRDASRPNDHGTGRRPRRRRRR